MGVLYFRWLELILREPAEVRLTVPSGQVIADHRRMDEWDNEPHEGRPLVDFTASGLTHVNRDYAAVNIDYRVADPHVEPNFGLVEIDWQAKGAITLTISAVGLQGVKRFDYRIDAFGHAVLTP